MGIECKVCLSEKRDYIEQLILQGNSNLTISATMKDMNEDISHASIGRHKTKHMPDYADTVKENAGEKGNRKYDREDSKNAFAINASGIYDEIRKLALHSVNYDELAKNNFMLQLMLNRIVNNQMAITIDLQEKYMKGDSKYPNEQIRGLQIIQDMAQKFEEFARKNFSHYKSLMHSSNGIKQHIVEMGKKAKQEMALIKPYEKGALFSFVIGSGTFEDYEKEYNPVNPYQPSDFDKECNYNYYQKGVELGYCQDEILDSQLFNLLCEVWEVCELIDEAEFNRIISRYTSGKYNACKEMAKYRKMIKEYENENEEAQA